MLLVKKQTGTHSCARSGRGARRAFQRATPDAKLSAHKHTEFEISPGGCDSGGGDSLERTRDDRRLEGVGLVSTQAQRLRGALHLAHSHRAPRGPAAPGPRPLLRRSGRGLRQRQQLGRRGGRRRGGGGGCLRS
eukprot:3858680-Rhodomonas_salina.1